MDFGFLFRLVFNIFVLIKNSLVFRCFIYWVFIEGVVCRKCLVIKRVEIGLKIFVRV